MVINKGVERDRQTETKTETERDREMLHYTWGKVAQQHQLLVCDIMIYTVKKVVKPFEPKQRSGC